MRLIIVRHGQTEYNRKNLLQGQGGIGLNSQGWKEAKKATQRLKKESIDVAYVSDLQRAQETAKEILRYHKLVKIVVTSALRERHHGVFEGRPAQEMIKAREKSKVSFHKFKPQGGESYQDVQRRVGLLYHRLCQKYKEETVLLISHGGTIRALLLLIFKESFSSDNYPKYHHGNCAITILEISKTKKPKIEVLNCLKHII